MGNFDGNGDGVVDMYIDATAQAVGGLRAHADALQSALGAAFAAINECSGKLGKGGQLSDVFMASYRPWRDGADGAPGLDTAVNDLPGMYRVVADNGDQAVGVYRSAEAEATGRLQS